MSLVPSPLVGRAQLLTSINRQARAGHGVVLTGGQGSGGSRLVAEAYRASRRAGLRSARLIPTINGRDGGPRFHLEGPAEPDLQVVFVDDAALLDDDTGSLLLRLARAGTAVVANATGSTAIPAPLRALIEEDRASTVPVEPLTLDEVAALAGQLLGDPVDGDLAQALSTASAGRPGPLVEVIEDATRTQAIERADGQWHRTEALPPARSLRAAVLEGFAALSPELRGWIAAVARAGAVAPDLATRIAATDTIEAARAAGWTMQEADGGTRPVSALVATVVLGSLDARARTSVVRRLVAAAEASTRPLDPREHIALTGWQLDLGMPPEPEEARRLALLPETPPDTREALLRAAIAGGAPADAELADHLRRMHRPNDALRVIEEALPSARGQEERRALIRARTMTTGVVERRSGDALRELDAHLAGSPDPELLGVRSSMLLLEARPGEAARTAEAVLADATVSPEARTFARFQLALALRELGRTDAALDAAAHVGAEPESVGRVLQHGAALAAWLPAELAFAVAADTDAVRLDLESGFEAVPAEHAAAMRPPLAYTLGGILVLRGDPAGAVRLLREADAGCGAWREGWLPRILSELSIAQALSGAIDDAAATADRLARLTVPPVQRGRVDLAAAQRSAVAGDLDAARARAVAVADRGLRAGLALDAFDGEFAALRYGDPEAPDRLLDLGPLPSGAGRTAQRDAAAALASGDPAVMDLAAVALWNHGLRLFAVELGARAAGLGHQDAATRLVGWLARTPSLRLPGLVDRRSAGLTAREREVAVLAAGGASDREIAEQLDISLRTAQTHLGRALAKLGIHRRTELRGLVVEP